MLGGRLGDPFRALSSVREHFAVSVAARTRFSRVSQVVVLVAYVLPSGAVVREVRIAELRGGSSYPRILDDCGVWRRRRARTER
jgi:hypothetical protein